MTLNANRRTAMYAGVAALAAIVGAGVAWKRQELGAIAPEALNAFWAAEFDTPAGEPLSMKTLQGRPLVINFWVLRLLATWALQSVAGQHRVSWVQMSVSEVAPLWGVKTGRCVLGWSEVSHLCS
jgi:hypothetical protein